MRTLPRLLAALLVVSVAGASAAAGEPSRSAAPTQKFKSPYVPGSRPLPTGSLVRLGGDGTTHAHASMAQYKDLSLGVQALLRRFSPDKHFFIGTGRDPAPIIAALENLGGRALAMNFPASNIVQSHGITPELIGQYFERLVPDETQRADILSGRRTLVLLDQSTSGKTPRSLEPHFKAYFKSIGAKVKTIKLAFSESPGLLPGVQRIPTTEFPDVARYLYSPYEGVVSEFPRHVLGSDNISALKQRPQYLKFRDAVLQRMRRDKGLHDFLMTEGQGAFVKESKAERENRIAAETSAAEAAAREEQEKNAGRTAEARMLPERLAKSLGETVALLPPAKDGTRKLALSATGRKLATWLKSALASRTVAAKYSEELKNSGPNLVVAIFLERLDSARTSGQLSSSDHRHLIAHALSAAEMDPTMTASLVAHFKESDSFRRQLSEGIDFFLQKPSVEHRHSRYGSSEYSSALRPATTHTAKNYKALLGALLKSEG